MIILTKTTTIGSDYLKIISTYIFLVAKAPTRSRRDPWKQAIKSYITARVTTMPSDYLVSSPAEYRREAIRVSQQRQSYFQEKRVACKQ